MVKNRERLLELKVYRRRRKNIRKRKQSREHYSFLFKQKLIHDCTPLIGLLSNKGYMNDIYVCTKIPAPENFSFKENFEGSILFLKRLISTFLLGERKRVEISFQDCQHLNIANFMLFDLIVEQLKYTLQHYNSNLSVHSICTKNIVVSESSKKDDKVNKYLLAYNYLKLIDVDNVDGDEMYLALGLKKGWKRAYNENSKGSVARDVVMFVEKSLKQAKNEMDVQMSNAIECLVTEVLDNAEEHSLFRTEWYVNGISFEETQHNASVVELNLSILNFGSTMYESFENTRNKNKENYAKLQKLYLKQARLFTKNVSFSREALFMLYMLSSGISRLKYQNQARGTGTVTFMRSFLYLGRYGIEHQYFNPHMNLISGNSVLTCDGKVKPFKNKSGFEVLTLNNDETFDVLPNSNYLCSHNENFPGTILECKLYLNKDFLNNKEQY